MKISKLTLTDWRSHKSTTLDFGAVNLLRGPNACGKSSVADAIEFLLTGRCAHTGAAGQGGDSLVRVGAKKAIIVALCGVNGELAVTRSRSLSGSDCVASMGGREYAGKKVEEMLDKKGWSRDVLSAVLRAGRFAELEPSAQKELLADVLKPEAVVAPKEIQDASALFGFSEPAKPLDLEGIRTLEEWSTRQRAECTAALRELGEPEKIEPASPETPTIRQTQGKIDGLRMEQNGLIREKDRQETTWATNSARRRELPKLIEKAKAGILPEEQEKSYLEAIEHEQETQRANEEIRRIGIQVEEYRRQIKDAEKRPGKCPSCGAESDTEAFAERIQGSISSCESRLPVLYAIRDKFPDVSVCRSELNKHRNAVVDADRLRGELEALGGDAPPPNTKDLQVKIDELEGRIKKGETVKEAIIRHEERYEAYVAAQTSRNALEVKREAADRIAKWAGPSGVQAQMAGGKLSPFVEAINAVLGRFGYACSIEMNPYSIRVRRLDRDKVDLQLESLSESELWRFSLGFQAALAKASGVGMVVLDRADVLVGELRGEAIRTLLSCQLDQVFLMASVADRPVLPSVISVFDLSLNAEGETILMKGT